MPWHRKLAFSALTAAFVFGLIEGAARLVWWRLEARAFEQQLAAGERILRNDAINFMKVPDGRYGFAMKANFQQGQVAINSAGFLDRGEIPVARTPGRLRIVCLGESTTFGNGIDSNYPASLEQILESQGTPAEVINAGVPGWVSDQVALRAEHQMASYLPDAVVLYVGWNDFQSYNPMVGPPRVSYWVSGYKGQEWKQEAAARLRSVALLSSLYHGGEAGPTPDERSTATDEGGHYRFLFQNLDRTLTAFRRAKPDVQIFVSTLVGRWPAGTAEEWQKIPSVWWMERHKVSTTQAAALVGALNDQIREYAGSRRVHLIDMAADFERLDRAALQWDWAHMTSEGYELMAWTIYDALGEAGLAGRAGEPERARLLREKFRAPASQEAEPAGAP
jgi:lysophospholipase L1-like esterase